ncbi:CpsD/CapB family tyrosine-protein kinase [Acidobacterium sp. S8]|uniref:CpsD/CapB family tyrosine-protein kinase n=1 Tax=Acidobacterium sp. S8 TaxID=1641854 RepID=UPI00131BD8D5|nr:CpsD/CapB family tyrosine-protein kinase [Acidobacterium sp. S8]
MSRIFDALQKSEMERAGSGASTLSAAADLLQVVERQSVSAWEVEKKTQPSIAVEERSAVALLDETPDIFSQFPALEVSITPQSQLVSLTDNGSLAAEKFRFLGVRLRHLQRERTLKKVLITSTVPHEGKSMVAANLAFMLARKKNQKVLLIDGDLRRPSLAQLFGTKPTPGICEWLQEEHNSLGNIYHLEKLDLWYLPAGTPSTNPLELLQSSKLTALMERLNSMFDWVVIDSPPVLPLADTSVWSRIADGVLLVTRQGTTQKKQLIKGIEALDQHKLIGTLLNSSRSSSHSDYYYGYGSPPVDASAHR